MAKKVNKHYKTDDKKKIITVREIIDLTKNEKEEIKFLIDCGYSLEITHEKKQTKEPVAGFSKIHRIYYLECEAPETIVKEYIKICDTEVKKGGGFMKANTKIFNPWFEENKAELDENGKKKKYNGEAAKLIEKNGEAAKKRIKELIDEDTQKKEKKAEEKKKK